MADRLLLHVCCGPCASASIPAFKALADEVVGFFHNPNIHPFMEYRRRLTGAREVAHLTGITLSEDLSYDPGRWFSLVVGEMDRSPKEYSEAMEEPVRQRSRCVRCIALRLDRAAAEAAAQGCAAFSTTLAISPWQDHEAIRTGGDGAAKRYGVDFVYQDLRRLYPESRRLSREWGVYRQKYCGCLLSEWERYREG